MNNKKFQPKPGQIDYSRARWVPVINCFVKYKDKFLLVERSNRVGFYPGYWHVISGFLDDHKSLKEKTIEELKEELNISEKDIKSIKVGEIFDQEARKYEKTWIVHPLLVEVKTNDIRIDWEAVKYRWVSISEFKKYKLLPGFERALKNLIR